MDFRVRRFWYSMKKISNVDSLSALFDRLITERIKHYFFTKEGDAIKIAHQNDIILQLKLRIADTLQECLLEHDYDVITERRTFSLDEVVGSVDMLTMADILVGENDRKALSGMQSGNVNDMEDGIKGFRSANENRAKSKNFIDNLFKKVFKR